MLVYKELLRRRGDLNSRAAFTTYRISSATPSASWVLLHTLSIVRIFSSINAFLHKKTTDSCRWKKGLEIFIWEDKYSLWE